MNISNTKLDLDFVRSQFPAFKDPLCKDWSFFENAGGSYVPQQVIDRLNNFMISTKVQPYAEYPMSKIAGDNFLVLCRCYRIFPAWEHLPQCFSRPLL